MAVNMEQSETEPATAGVGRVESVQVCPGHRQPMQPVAEAITLVGRGLAGDAHNRERGARQVLLQDVETLEAFGLPPGSIKENITTRGLPINRLPEGQRLQIGATVILQLTGVCEPCHRMDEIRPGLQTALEGRRGMLARVIQGGPIRQNDPIRLLPAEDGP